MDDQVWELVKMGTKLEDEIIKPKNPSSDRSLQHVVRAHQGDPKEIEAYRICYDQDRGRFGQDVVKSHPTVASLPANEEFCNELSALAPASEEYVDFTMDSGASIHAAWMQKPFPGHFVRRSIGQKNGEFAHANNGE